MRGLLRVAMGGLKYNIMWSATLGVLFRPEARLRRRGSSGPHGEPELQIGGAIAYANLEYGFAVGPEVVLSSRTSNLFQQYATSLTHCWARTTTSPACSTSVWVAASACCGSRVRPMPRHVAPSPMRRCPSPSPRIATRTACLILQTLPRRSAGNRPIRDGWLP